MNEQLLMNTASHMVSNGKGILAADESTPTIGKRFAQIGVESTFESRNEYRDMLFTADNMEKNISGVIMYDETLRQSTTSENKISFTKLLSDKDVLPGIKVDTGAKQLAGAPGEKITEGLDGLRERLVEYYEMGARFAKWRAVITIGDDIPSDHCIYSNAHALARYASLCQESNIVPIVEPEVLMDGDHSAEDCLNKTSEVIKKCFEELILHKIDLSGMILKPNMILAGNNSKNKISNEEVADKTLECLKNSVPKEVPGIAFLSGGQSEIEATENLNLISKNNNTNFIMTYSYGRALQQSALKVWSKNITDIASTQNTFNHRAKMCTLAAQGKWASEFENK